MRWWQLMAYFNRAKKELDLKRISCLWGKNTREPESRAPQVLEQVATENEKGTDPRYFHNRWKEQRDRNFRNTAFRKGVTAWFEIWWFEQRAGRQERHLLLHTAGSWTAFSAVTEKRKTKSLFAFVNQQEEHTNEAFIIFRLRTPLQKQVERGRRLNTTTTNEQESTN